MINGLLKIYLKSDNFPIKFGPISKELYLAFKEAYLSGLPEQAITVTNKFGDELTINIGGITSLLWELEIVDEEEPKEEGFF